jgi:hypothetical protein
VSAAIGAGGLPAHPPPLEVLPTGQLQSQVALLSSHAQVSAEETCNLPDPTETPFADRYRQSVQHDRHPAALVALGEEPALSIYRHRPQRPLGGVGADG